MNITAETVFAVSGGARGITAQCVIALAQRFACRFILIGRTAYNHAEADPTWAEPGLDSRPELQKRYTNHALALGEKPAPMAIRQAVDHLLARREIRNTLRAIETAGGQAIYIPVDILNIQELRNALIRTQYEMGTVTALLHGAGNLADKRIENKTVHDFEYVYGAKVDGLKNLLDCLPIEQLNYLILFSSAAGFYGNVGQADYAMVNEILNKVAHHFAYQYPHCKVYVFDWGPWDGGMVTSELRQSFVERNVQLIPVEVGANILVDTLEQIPYKVQFLVGHMPPPPRSTISPDLGAYQIRRRLSLEGNPFLFHHTIGEHPVLPMTHALNWLASACEDLYPGYYFSSFEDYQVLKGIVFDADFKPDYLLSIQELQKNATSITLQCVIQNQLENGKSRYHYKAQITLRAAALAAPKYFEKEDTAFTPLDGKLLYSEGTLFHGPYFQGIQRILNLSSEKLTMACMCMPVPAQIQGQFPVQAINPYVYDMATQAAVVWTRKMMGSASLPLAYESGVIYHQVPDKVTFDVSMQVQRTTVNELICNLVIYDDEGQLYGQINGAHLIVNPDLNAQFNAS